MWIYEKTSDNTARFVLGTVGTSPLLCFGINPSTAEPNKLDPTLKTVERMSIKSPEFDSFIMFNVYAQRATNPDDLHKTPLLKLKKSNEEHISQIVDGKAFTIWAAWGNLIEKRPYLKMHLADIVSLKALENCIWVSRAAITKRGHPHHPLYIKEETPFDIFDMKKYKKEFLDLSK